MNRSPTPAQNLSATNVSATTSATLLAAARPSRRGIVIRAVDAAVYIGKSGVTTGAGFKLNTGDSITLGFTGALYGITASGTCDVRVLDEY